MTVNRVPPEFQFAHEFCFDLHNRLVDLIHHADNVRAYSTRTEIRNEDRESLAKVQNGDILDWLSDHGYHDELGDLLFKRVFPALLTDFCNFVFEALSCSRKGKLAVTWTLLRKPFKENLHYLEYLLADPSGLLNALYYKDPLDLTVDISSGKPMDIVQKAVSKTHFSTAYDSETIFRYRYDKTASISLDRQWTKAPHIVTFAKEARTPKQSLNLIFDSDEERYAQYQHLYLVLPYLLFYAVDISEILMAHVLKRAAPFFNQVMIHKVLGFALWTNGMRAHGPTRDGKPFVQEDLLELVSCPFCGQKLDPDMRILETLYKKTRATCSGCGRVFSVDDMVKVA